MNVINETALAVKRGRPINATSVRQARLAAWEAKRASGLEVKRGRPAKLKIDPKQKQYWVKQLGGGIGSLGVLGVVTRIPQGRGSKT